jgi:hypothetical protein
MTGGSSFSSDRPPSRMYSRALSNSLGMRSTASQSRLNVSPVSTTAAAVAAALYAGPSLSAGRGGARARRGSGGVYAQALSQSRGTWRMGGKDRMGDEVGEVGPDRVEERITGESACQGLSLGSVGSRLEGGFSFGAGGNEARVIEQAPGASGTAGTEGCESKKAGNRARPSVFFEEHWQQLQHEKHQGDFSLTEEVAGDSLPNSQAEGESRHGTMGMPTFAGCLENSVDSQAGSVSFGTVGGQQESEEDVSVDSPESAQGKGVEVGLTSSQCNAVAPEAVDRQEQLVGPLQTSLGPSSLDHKGGLGEQDEAGQHSLTHESCTASAALAGEAGGVPSFAVPVLGTAAVAPKATAGLMQSAPSASDKARELAPYGSGAKQAREQALMQQRQRYLQRQHVLEQQQPPGGALMKQQARRMQRQGSAGSTKQRRNSWAGYLQGKPMLREDQPETIVERYRGLWVGWVLSLLQTNMLLYWCNQCIQSY